MDTVNISTFKATCPSLVDRVKRTGRPLLITRRGETIAEVIPPPAPEGTAFWIGGARGTGTIHGDLLEPTGERREAEDR